MNKPGLAAIRAAAPWWANYLCVTLGGDAFWQSRRGRGRLWLRAERWQLFGDVQSFPANEPVAINLNTSTVYLMQPDGSILEVTRQEWDV